jgi:hypothetical protein
MGNSDQLLRLARSELTLGGGSEPEDLRLLDHSLRVAACAQILARVPEVAQHPVDNDVLWVAGLFHELGWAIQVRDGKIERERVMTRPTTDIQLELAAGQVEAMRTKVLPAAALSRAAQAIRGINNRNCEAIEAHLVADADTLDQIGPVGFLQSVRRDVMEGRPIRHVLDAWHRQQEYRYWEARIRDGIRFESVREMAWKRLAALDPFMQALADQIDGQDLAESLGISAAEIGERLGAALGGA